MSHFRPERSNKCVCFQVFALLRKSIFAKVQQNIKNKNEKILRRIGRFPTNLRSITSDSLVLVPIESFYWLSLYSKYFCSVIILLELLLLNQLALLIVKIIDVFWIIFLRLSVLKISVILTLSPLDRFVCFVRLFPFNGMNWNSEIRSWNHLGLRAKIKWFFW